MSDGAPALHTLHTLHIADFRCLIRPLGSDTLCWLFEKSRDAAERLRRPS